MKLSRPDFERRYAEGELRIALVGMSNIGKSYTGMRLATAFDFELIEVDKLIREQLGHDDMDAFAAWQGQPYSDGYADREAESKRLESAATQNALGRTVGNAVLDTTGSVIYIDKSVQENLINDWYIIHIRASDDAVERLKTQYFKQPKPLMWNGHFHQHPDQDPDDAILECYPKLLASRAKDYAALADTTIESDVILDTNLTIQDILERLKPAV
jgi:shikimate kinase